MECFWIPWSPHDHYTPASLHLTFPLVPRVHLRRPSDFRLTFANTVAVIHNKASWLILGTLSCSLYYGDRKSTFKTHRTAHVLGGNSRRNLAICYGKIASFP